MSIHLRSLIQYRVLLKGIVEHNKYLKLNLYPTQKLSNLPNSIAIRALFATQSMFDGLKIDYHSCWPYHAYHEHYQLP